MAEDKTSFILYADLLHTVKKMPPDKAGLLFLTILEYVNDLAPVVDDLLVDLVFEPIKQQLKRDLKSYEATKEERSRNGRLGNLKRWSEDLYNQVQSNIITLEEAENIANSRKPSHSDSEVTGAIKKIANIADNDNVNDTVNDNDIKPSIVGSTSSSPTDGTLTDSDRCHLFVRAFNSKKVINGKQGQYQATDKVCKALKQRLKNYKSKDLLKVLDEALKDEMHKEKNFMYLTPEYILRENIIERYLNVNHSPITTSNGNYVP